MKILTREELDAEFRALITENFGSAENFARVWNAHMDALEELDAIGAQVDYSPYSTVNS